jgi:hypothetical protein
MLRENDEWRKMWNIENEKKNMYKYLKEMKV